MLLKMIAHEHDFHSGKTSVRKQWQQPGQSFTSTLPAAAEQCDWKAVLQDVSPFLENVIDRTMLNKETMLSALKEA